MHFRLIFLSVLWCSIQSLNVPRGVYIHIPFCRRRCHYCNFPVVVVGERPSSHQQQGDLYTALLLREVKTTFANTNESLAALETVYFGGGTPSLLPVECIDQILTELKSTVGFCQNAEITLEMDPGTFDSEKLTQIRATGVTRISLGIQSFDSKILKDCGRAHTVEDVARALNLVLASEFKDNFSIDLISSLPGLGINLWQETLQKAADCGCSHVSVYDLQIEDKTAFGRWYSPGVFPLPTDEQSALMYCRATEVLKAAGFEHYEVSNYARLGKRSQHNQQYWKCKPTWGFGMGAASFIANNRFTRPDRLAGYTKWVADLEINGFAASTVNIEDDEGSTRSGSVDSDEGVDGDDGDDGDDGGHLILSEGIITPEGATDILEVVMLALRTSDGLNLRELGDIYGEVSVERILNAVLPFKDRGLIEIKELQEGAADNFDASGIAPTSLTKIVCLTDPQGFLLSNDIISSIFVELTC